MWVMACLLIQNEESVREWHEVRRTASQKYLESEKHLKSAHDALDKGEYEQAAAEHKLCKKLREQAQELQAKAVKMVPSLAESILPFLEHDEHAVRDRATTMLAELGPEALPVVQKALEKAEPESKLRLQQLVEAWEPKRGPVVRGNKKFKPNELIVVRVENFPDPARDWVTIVPADAGHWEYGEYFWGTAQTADGFAFKGLPAGEYEVRVFLDWPNGGYNVAARFAFSVRE